MKSQIFVACFVFLLLFVLSFQHILADGEIEIATTTEDTGLKIPADQTIFGGIPVRRCTESQILVRGRCRLISTIR